MELRRYLMAIGMRGNVNDQIGRDVTGVPSLHSQTVHAARRVSTAIM